MDEKQTNDKIKVLNVFQNEEIAGNRKKMHYPNKFEFEKGIIRNAIVSTNSSKCTKLEERDREKKNCIIFREQCEYCLTNFSISGHLILTKESLLFEPDLRDKNVITYGFGTYQIFIDLYDIYECAHIVVPTKDTYLCNNEDTCGFIQVLLKSIYNRICDDASQKKNSTSSCYSGVNSNSSTDDLNKQKSVSYYKYISRSLSYVFNLAQPLVQNTSSFKEEKNDHLLGGTTYSSDISKHNNIVEHLQDSDLKIYQKINEADYSSAIPAHPNITYKNNLNLANSGYSFKESEGNNATFLSGRQKKDSFSVTKEASSKEVSSKGGLSTVGKPESGFPNVETSNSNFTQMSGSKEGNSIKREDTVTFASEAQRSCSKTLKNISFELHHQTLRSSSTGGNYSNTCGGILCTDGNQVQWGNKGSGGGEPGQNLEGQKKAQKKYEEKSFILFRFFNNNKAYETTTKIIKEIDEVRKSENKIKKTITSVPFTSNELLRCIIEQSLMAKESKKKTQGTNSTNDIKDLNYLPLIPKLEYINGAVKLLSKEMTKQINYYLPPTLSIKIWKLVFCSSIHGVSFKTLYRSVSNKGSVILLICDMENVLFGCFLDKLHCDNCYYGSGENFLFTFKNVDKALQGGKEKKIKDEDENVDNNRSSCAYDKSIDNFYPLEENVEKVKRKNTALDMNEGNLGNNSMSNSQEKLATDFEDSLKDSIKGDASQEGPSRTSPDYMNRLKTDIHDLDCGEDEEASSTVGGACSGGAFGGNDKGASHDKDNITSEDCYHDNDENRGASSDAMQYRTKTLNEEKYHHLTSLPGKKQPPKGDNPGGTKTGETSEKKQKKQSGNDNASIQVFNWTTRNNYFVYSDEKSITIGGGDNYSLLISDDLCKGQTNRSSTYDNDLLTHDEEFEIQFLQLWVFDDS
ncbi:TLD domain-containing protein [Plasmodium cynomolgi strain B]|uniref:Oxidation resistance protein 1 n=1 Tax=Plasmodium cynomolgi (strain B) TaxID=1120755 RepID=K6UD07_PLACD|nr:TLD domain-containing protein [Plasmodium cynomolgi strain B]GAB65771.1 TLD domain-containing protein [Plasmodium cynomolgi strain B]